MQPVAAPDVPLLLVAAAAALQIALAGNCVYEQTGQGSTQETRNKTADIASLPSTGERQLPRPYLPLPINTLLLSLPASPAAR